MLEVTVFMGFGLLIIVLASLNTINNNIIELIKIQNMILREIKKGNNDNVK